MKIGFIGTGNMGGALATACAKSAVKKELLLADYSAEKAVALAKTIGAAASTNGEIARTCDYIFLGVKPQMQADVMAGIAAEFAARAVKPVLISMAAGVTIATVLSRAGCNCPVIRIMPNTPVEVGGGLILYACSEMVTAEMKQDFLAFMADAGMLDELAEKLIDAGCAVSGCGPAFACLFAEALADGGVCCGLPRDKAAVYAAQMLCGTASLLLQSGKNPGTLKDAVCSPAGSTIEGVRTLEEGAFRGAVMDAVIAAYEKTKQLG